MQTENQDTDTSQNEVEADFVESARSAFAAVQPEIAERNKTISENDQYIYGDLLQRRLDIPIGHDNTPVNWLRRTVEIHRSQFMGKGFAVDSSYVAQDITASGVDDQSASGDPQLAQAAQADKTRLQIENEKAKGFAELRRQLVEAIIRDNGGDAFWASAAENASAVGDTAIKAWYDQDKKKYTIQQIEYVDNFYVLWDRDDYRNFNAVAYIYQVTPQDAVSLYGVSPDVQTSPMGSPLSILQSNSISQKMSMQPMVTIMEITGKLSGWWTDGNGHLSRCKLGSETAVNIITVGNTVYQIIDDEKSIPKYYILPNKRARRRPWGLSDITWAAVQINLTYIEALSDWRTVASKVNFPKFKGIGFGSGVQIPKPKPRTVEIIPLADGQDIQPMVMGQAAQLGESDFRNQLVEMENQFVREVGISRQLFDMPDVPSNSNPATLTAMKSVSDITDAKRALWEPKLRDIFEDALRTSAMFDKNIASVVNDDSDWHIKISWPGALNSEDPSFQAMKLNQFNSSLLSIQTFLEETGYDKQEYDRIREELEDPTMAAIHGHTVGQLAEYKLIPFGTPLPPKVSVNLRGDMTPEQEANIASQRGFNNGPFPPTMGPQGNAGLTAEDNGQNTGLISGKASPGGTAVNVGPDGTPVPNSALAATSEGATPSGGTQPEPINGPAQNQPGVGVMSQPGSGAPATSAEGKLAQHAQRRGK